MGDVLRFPPNPLLRRLCLRTYGLRRFQQSKRYRWNGNQLVYFGHDYSFHNDLSRPPDLFLLTRCCGCGIAREGLSAMAAEL